MDDTAPIHLSVVIPALNEGALIDKVVEEAIGVLDRHASSYEIVVVDDGSTDETAAKAEAMRLKHACVRVCTHEQRRGVGAALKTGFRSCRGELVTWIPGDGQFDLEEVLAGVALMATHDVVLVIREGRNQAVRGFISLCFHLLIRIMFRFDATDMCGIYIIPRGLLNEIQPRSDDVFMNLEVALLCQKRGKRLGQISARVRPRLGGVSKVDNVRTMAKNLYELTRFRLKYL